MDPLVSTKQDKHRYPVVLLQINLSWDPDSTSRFTIKPELDA
jgi:hypothetical protein